MVNVFTINKNNNNNTKINKVYNNHSNWIMMIFAEWKQKQSLNGSLLASNSNILDLFGYKLQI